MKKQENIHAGHKKRLRDKFAVNGDLSALEDHEILELLLNFIQVRKNMNGVAHNLLDKFGSLDSVFDARTEDLMTVKGVGKVTATGIGMQRHLFSIYLQRKYGMDKKKIADEDFQSTIWTLFAGAQKELFYMFCINENSRIIKTTLMSRGSDDGVLFDQREIVKIALSSNARGVIFAHNHLTGIATPSNDDIINTKNLRNSLESLGVKLIDHFVVAGDKCVSISEDNRYRLLK